MLDPLLEDRDVVGTEPATLGHLERPALPNSLDQQTLLGIAAYDERASAATVVESRLRIETKTAGSRITMAFVAVIREDGSHLVLEEIRIYFHCWILRNRFVIGVGRRRSGGVEFACLGRESCRRVGAEGAGFDPGLKGGDVAICECGLGRHLQIPDNAEP